MSSISLKEKLRQKKAWHESHVTLPREIRRCFQQESLPDRLRPFRNKYEGRRCFVIGNGPSLRPEDLDRLQGEITFASNWIGKIYDRTVWRATYFSCMDPLLVREHMAELLDQGQEASFLPVYAENWADARNWLHHPSVFPVEMTHGYPADVLPPFSDNAAEILYGGYSVTYCLLQLAVYMGFKEIILLGMDHTYAYNMNYGTVIDSSSDRPSHFYKDTNPTGTNIVGVTNAYTSARNWADAHGIRILNATRGGCLEVFERADFDALVPPADHPAPDDKSSPEQTDEFRAFFESGTPEVFDRLAADHGMETVLTEMMRQYPSLPDQARLADRLAGAGSLRRQPREIHCIGVFYYRISRGGTERVLCHLLRLWDQLGYRTVLFTDFPASPEDEPLPDGTKRILLPDTFTLTEESRLQRFLLLRQAISEEQIDCFVHHAWLSKNLLWDLLAVKTLGVPFVVYTHSSPSCLFMDEDPDNMDELPHLTRILRPADRIICLSKTFEAFWRRFNPNTSLLLNPCSLPEGVSPAAHSFPEEAPLLLWAGRFSPEKQPREALRILREVRKILPGARLALLGSGGETYRDLEDSLREEVQRTGLADAVEMPGFVPDPAPWYNRASVLLLTSQYEGFSLVIAEAKLRSIPTVMYDLPYLYFAEEKKGLLTVPQGDATAAAAAVCSLLTDKAAWTAASAEALESSRVFSDEALSAAWQELFRALSVAPESAETALTDPDTAVLEMLLSQLHFGLETVKKKETARQRDAAGGLLNSVFDAEYYAARCPDLKQAFGNDPMALLRHYLEFGLAEGRSASPLLDPKAYAGRYPDLKQAFGEDWKALALHFLLYGRKENRRGN